MEKNITVTIEVERQTIFKTMLGSDKVDLNALSGHVAEGIGRALREKSEGFY